MKRIGRVALPSLYCVIALVLGFVLSSYLFLAVDSNYHDGYGFTGAIVVGVVAAIATFRAF